MRILFVWPIVHFSIWDVAQGHRRALAKLVGDENIKDYYLDKRVAYHQMALPENVRTDVAVLSKLSSESVLAEALYFGADAVFIVSGLNFHPCGIWLLGKAGIPTGVLFTESPYEDVFQQEWAAANANLRIMTNELVSAENYGWTYIRHAYEPETHRPCEAQDPCDVLLVGSGWPERQALLESVDWTGIDLRIHGVWPDLTEASPIYRFVRPELVHNSKIAPLYCGAKICLNIHRNSLTAKSLGPRAYEIAGCGAFQLSDFREELLSVFGDAVPMFSHSGELEQLIRYYLSHEHERRRRARDAHDRVASQTFDHRAALVLNTLTQQASALKETA